MCQSDTGCIQRGEQIINQFDLFRKTEVTYNDTL